MGGPWRRFRYTVAPSSLNDGLATDRMVISSAPTPSEYFNAASLGLERRMAAGIPGAFLSVGLLVAGLGLAVALAKVAASIGQAGADPAATAAATKAGIAAASGKILLMFVVGAIALVLRFIVAWMRAGAAQDVARFNGALVEHIHFANAESVGVRQQDALHFQAKSLQKLGEELATSMGQSTRSAIMEGYADIASRLEALAARYADLVDAAQEGAREAVTQGFEKSVDANAGEVLRRMEAVAEAMAAMPTRLEEGFRSSVDAGTKDVVTRMQEVSDAMAALPARVDQVAVALENAGADLAGRQAGFVSRLQDEAAESAVTTARTIADNVQTATQNALMEVQDAAGRIVEGLVRLPDRIETAAKTFEAASGRMAEVQETVAERSQAQALDAVASVTAMISRAVDGLAKDVEETISVSLRQTTDTIRTVAQGMSVLPDRIEGAAATLEQASEKIAGAQSRVLGEMRESARETAASTARTIANAVDENTATFLSRLEDSNEVFKERAEALSGLFATLQRASDRIADTHVRFLSEMQDGTREMISSMARTVADEIKLKTAELVAQLRQSDKDFNTRIAALTAIAEQAGKTSHALSQTIDRMAAENDRVEKQVATISGSLAGTTEGMQKSAQSLAGNLAQIDNSLSAFQSLSKETIETVGSSQKNIRETLGALHKLWQGHVERFDDVDAKLGGVFGEISGQIDMQTRLMRDQIGQMDSALAAAVSHLGELVEELSEARGSYRGSEALK